MQPALIGAYLAFCGVRHQWGQCEIVPRYAIHVFVRVRSNYMSGFVFRRILLLDIRQTNRSPFTLSIYNYGIQ